MTESSNADKTLSENVTPSATITSPTITTPTSIPTALTSSISGIPTTSKLKMPKNFSGSTASLASAATNAPGTTASKISRPCCLATPKAGPPTRDTNMSRESDDNLSSINSAYTDMYQDTVKRFTRSSLSPEMDRYSSSSPISTKSNSKSSPSPNLDPDRRLSFDFYVEATGRRRSSDQGAVLTVDTEQFIIGQRIWVGGARPGTIAYIGETHFAPGEWAGIVLDEPNGKNDGCVAGKRYFQCEPKRGIFSRLTRLTLAPLPGAIQPSSPLSKYTPDRSHTVSPTASIPSSVYRSPGKNGLTVGDRVIVSSGFGSRPGKLRYLGETRFASGNWCGIELDEPTGKNDGSVDGFRYFECQPKYGIFVPIAKVSLSPSSKKSRLSRAGSRESLTSIGTMNSIATTNTSRLRMSAQRKPSSIKPITTPKSQFSMQDLLREKHNHIEQLMIERDLDREDAQNQALQFQKNISELQNRISELERKLKHERKKTEDLQFSMDEATFCGDELNAQTQVYKEKIHDLEHKILKLSLGTQTRPQEPSVEDQTAAITAVTEAAKEQIVQLSTKLSEQASAHEAQIAAIQEEEQRLHEKIKYLQEENQTLQIELLEKDTSLEKLSLSESGIENLRIELALLRQENERERQQTNAEYEAQVKRLTEELIALKNTLSTLESERNNVEDECEILRAECKSQNKQLQDLTDQVAKLSTELSVNRAESATLDELLKAQQQGGIESKTALEEKISEMAKLREEVQQLQSAKKALEEGLQKSTAEIKSLTEKQHQYEESLKVASSANETKEEEMRKLEAVIEEMTKQMRETEITHEKLTTELKHLSDLGVNTEAAHKELQKQLKDRAEALEARSAELEESKKTVEDMQQKLLNLDSDSQKALMDKDLEIKRLNIEIMNLSDKTKALESESSTTVQQMSMKIKELETEINQSQQSLKSSEAQLEVHRQTISKHESTIAEKLVELTKASNELESTSNLLDKRQVELTSVQKKCSDLEVELKQSVEQNTQQELQLGDLKRKYEALSAKSESFAKQNEDLQQDLLAARNSGLDMQATVRRLNEEIATKQKAFDASLNDSNTARFKLETQVEELQQKLDNKSKDYEELKESLQKSKDKLSKCNETITSLEEKTVKQELSLSDALRLQENLETRYETLAAQNASLQDDLMSLRTSSTDSNEELLKLSQEVAAKQKAYEELLDKSSAERSALESQLQASQQRVDILCNQVETFTQELKVTTEESFKRFEQLKLTEEKYSKQELQLADMARKLEAFEAKNSQLEKENESLKVNLSALQTDSSGTVLKLSEELSRTQKTQQEYIDKVNSENLQRESQIQELKKRFELAQAELESLRKELQSTSEQKAQQAEQFENITKQIKAKAQQELQVVETQAAAERKTLCEKFEEQLKNAEETKQTLGVAITGLQNQIQLLQDELLKSQFDFKAKEADLKKQVELLNSEKAELGAGLQKLQTANEGNLKTLQDKNAELQGFNEQLQQKEKALHTANSKTEEMKLAQSASSAETAKLEAQLLSLKNALEQSTTQLEHRSKDAEEDQKKIDELKAMLEAVQTSNAKMSATNAELSAALKKLESEKCETAHNFELFELEADQNVMQLRETHSKLEEKLSATQELLQATNTALSESQKRTEDLTAELQATQDSLNAKQTESVANVSKLTELHQANQELTESVRVKDAQILELNANRSSNQTLISEQTERINALQAQLSEIQNSAPSEEDKRKREDLESELAEYKKVVDEMDVASTEKTHKITELQKRLQELELAMEAAEQEKRKRAEDCDNLLGKLESLEADKMRDVAALQARINELQSSSNKLKQNGAGDDVAADEGENSVAHISFLNSIIVDMQKKNDTLKAKIEALEALPTDFTQPHAFDIISKRKPAPRVFCDICDVFDQHETEDCPVQGSSDREYSPPPSSNNNNNNDPNEKKDRKLPEPRKYCETCEVFGHEAGECDNDECY